MVQFTVYSAGCDTCKSAIDALKSAVAEKECGCSVEEVSCDGQCDAATRLGFAGKDRPIIVRNDEVVHEGALSAEQAAALLPVK